jgi:subtilisin family serine protease
MKRKSLCLLLALVFWTAPLGATGRLIVRVGGGLPVMQLACLVAGCTVAENIDGAPGQLYLVTTPDFLDVNAALQILLHTVGVVDAELDLVAHTDGSTYHVPAALSDTTPVNYYGSTTIEGYVTQPATGIIRLFNAQAAFPNATGAGMVAVIDTGVDPNHPVLKSVLLPGWDFTRNQSGADETNDFGPAPILGGALQAAWVNPNTSAALSESTVAVVDGNPGLCAFGHGTMVAGIIHLVAPTVKILPLKAFRADGTGYTSDILRAIYAAIAMHANIINMSFNLAAYSPEVATALGLATATRMILVAAAGNSGTQTATYPAALWNVMGIASTNNSDQLSAFSNYGPQLVWVAAPGEGVVTTYPFSTYAAGWGTSFSAPFVSGTAALMLSMNGLCDQYGSSTSVAHAYQIDPNAGHGRLDVLQAMQAWSGAL